MYKWQRFERRSSLNGATEAEAAEAEAAERAATVLRDSNPVKCSAVKPTCCGRSSRTPPSWYYQWSHRSRGRSHLSQLAEAEAIDAAAVKPTC